MTKNEDYPLFMHWYKTLDWILDRTEKMPKSVRFSISTRIASTGIDIIENIIETIYTKDKWKHLRNMNMNFEKLRVLFRICHERHYISTRQYQYISEQINEAGKMCGGWLKKCKE